MFRGGQKIDFTISTVTKIKFYCIYFFPLYVKPQNILLAERGPLLFLSGGPGLSGSCKS